MSILNSTSAKSMLRDAMANFKRKGGQNIVSFLESIINGQGDVDLQANTTAGAEGDDEDDELNFFDVFGDVGDSQSDPKEEEDAGEVMEGLSFLEIFGFADETAEVAEVLELQTDDGASETVSTSILLEVLRNEDFTTPTNVFSLENVTSEKTMEENAQITEGASYELQENATTMVSLVEALAEGNITSTRPTKLVTPSSPVTEPEDVQTSSTNASLLNGQKVMRKKRSEFTDVMRRYNEILESFTLEQLSRHGLAIRETLLLLKELVLSSRRRNIRGAAKKIPTLAGTRREKGKCRVFNLSCTELPPLNACRGVSLGGCLSRSKLYLFMMPRYMLAVYILSVAVLSIGSMVTAFEIYRNVTNRRINPVVQENAVEGGTEMTPNNNPMNGN